MYDPQTQAFDIKYPWRGTKSKWWPQGYRSSFITIWHVDPKRAGTGNRTDDSCGWFDRTPGPYADAVAYVLKDKSTMHDIMLTLARRERMPYPFYEGISEEQTYGHRLGAGDALALVLLVAHELETRRWWNGQNGKEGACRRALLKTFTRPRKVTEFAVGLALNPTDNLSHVDEPDRAVRLIAAALNRHFRPWWRHPRWHVHHWKFQIHPWQQFKRWAFDRCADCRKGFRWGESVWGYGDARIFHDGCGGHGSASIVRTDDPLADKAQ